MIALRRSRNPADVHPGFTGKGREKKELTLLQARRDHLQRMVQKPDAAHGYSSAWWKAAKAQLRRESYGKCAYCEARADATAHCDVEHFRPKSHWWWLTCCWDNYLFACQICNQQHKLDRFPFSGPLTPDPVSVLATTADAALLSMAGKLTPDPLDQPALEAWLKILAKEKIHALDPATVDPEAWLAYQEDDDAGQVHVIPRSNRTSIKRIAEASIELYGLNREELRQLRYEKLESLQLAHEALQTPGINPVHRDRLLKRLERFVKPRQAFAGMSRYYLIDLWGLLPASSRA